MIKIHCQHVSASGAGEQIFQILFEEVRDGEDGKYVLIQRAFLEEDDDDPNLIYVEMHDQRLIGHYPTLDVELARNRFTLRFPPPKEQTVEIDFVASDGKFREIKRMLDIILPGSKLS